MARNSDHRAGGLETDDTGGVLSGFLAEEEDLDRRALWRLGSWGVGAVAAVVVAVMANQTQFGWKRDQMAATDLSQRAQQIQNVANQTEREARRLAAAIDTLNSDRDRLYARVTGLERGLDSVTGSIARQNSAAASPAAASPAEPQAIQAAQTPAPTVAPVTTQTAAATPDKPVANPIAAEPGPAAVSSVAKDPAKDLGKETARETIKTELPKIEAKKTDPIRSEAAKPELAKAEAVKPEAVKSDTAKIDTVKIEAVKADAATPATPLVASQSFMAPPDPSATKLVEPSKPLSSVIASPIPEVMAAAPGTDAETDEETGPKVAIQRTQFGVDLGTANSVPGLRALWRGLLKSRSNAPLAALRPIIVIKESTNGLGMQLRLVAGPINDAGAAARICAVLTENKRNCETAIFDGQRLSLTGDNPAPAPGAKPAPRRRGAVAKRAAVVVEDPAKKPETSATTAVSSWFGKRGQ
ncbi:hypothetical protein [Bradyrhizobium sp. OAE829]|uniref:hypothetical protein n=1 Tax=Bradyrhizobium sp. OAE829 TaxID=2663807 RepID=UPI001788F8FA